MSKMKIKPKRMTLEVEEDKKSGKMKDSHLIFTNEEDEVQVKMNPKIIRILRDILSDVIHKEEMKEECDGFRIIDN